VRSFCNLSKVQPLQNQCQTKSAPKSRRLFACIISSYKCQDIFGVLNYHDTWRMLPTLNLAKIYWKPFYWISFSLMILIYLFKFGGFQYVSINPNESVASNLLYICHSTAIGYNLIYQHSRGYFIRYVRPFFLINENPNMASVMSRKIITC